METVRDILESKGEIVHSVLPDTFVFDALELMARYDIGALVVRDGDRLLGVFGEREYARKVILFGRSSHTMRVGEIMMRNVPTVGVDASIERCIQIMTTQRVRYLPVVDEGGLHGIVSIGDVVNALIAEREYEIDQLHHYIAGVP